MFGDLGADNPRALPRLRRDTLQGMYDAVLHVGEEASARYGVGVTPGLRGAGSRGQRGSKGTGEETGHGDAVAVNRAPGLKSIWLLELRTLVFSSVLVL